MNIIENYQNQLLVIFVLILESEQSLDYCSQCLIIISGSIVAKPILDCSTRGRLFMTYSQLCIALRFCKFHLKFFDQLQKLHKEKYLDLFLSMFYSKLALTWNSVSRVASVSLPIAHYFSLLNSSFFLISLPY